MSKRQCRHTTQFKENINFVFSHIDAGVRVCQIRLCLHQHTGCGNSLYTIILYKGCNKMLLRNGHALCMVNGVGKEDVEGSDRWQKDLSNPPPPPLGWEQHTYPHLLRKRLRPCLHRSHHPWRHNSRRCTHLWEEQWEGGAERGLG